MKVGVFKEPKGIIKVFELIFSICAFAVLTSYSSSLEFKLSCAVTTPGVATTTEIGVEARAATPETRVKAATTLEGEPRAATPETRVKAAAKLEAIVYGNTDNTTSTDPTTSTSTPTTTTSTTTTSTTPTTTSTTTVIPDQSVVIPIKYPFKLEKESSESEVISNCNGTDSQLVLEDKSSSNSVFFVFVGVLSFLFTLVMIPIYLFQDEIVAQVAFFPNVDLAIHLVFVILWFCGSIAFAAGVSNLKVSTNPQNVIDGNTETFDCDINTCSVTPPQNYAGPVVSVIFGFVNLMLYVGNLWFVYKDTPFST